MNSMKKRQRRATITALIFILPFFILFTIFTIYPVIQGIWVSLNKWNLMGCQKFVGLENYEKMFSDAKFWTTLKNTCFFTVITAPLIVVVSLVFALLANRPVRYKKFLRIAYYVPGVLSVSVGSFIAQYTFAPYRGLINGILTSMGLITTATEPQWFQRPELAWTVVVIMTVWWTCGFPMLMYLSALQDISPELMEAASVDGANARQKLFRITLPLLKPTIYLVAMLQIIASFKVFGQIRLITNGGPGNSTKSLVMYIYEAAFDKNKMGYSAAMSYALFIIIAVCVMIQMKLQKGDE
ncbi:MAG: sugar ABC transporter permease [Blautia sp.]|nr:sugar ABC transporter permease [Blautia sp.]MDY4000721.1 sugar ABC transporter permease [Blautia sp.]